MSYVTINANVSQKVFAAEAYSGYLAQTGPTTAILADNLP